MKRAEEILMDLVAIPSVSTVSNEAVVEYALRFFDRGMWRTVRHRYRDPAGVEKVNLVATTRGWKAGEAELALVCHTDTVPYQGDWKEAVHPVVRKGKLYGRGSCDVKGFLACVLEAASGTDVARLSKPLAVILTADEEIGCIGAKRLAATKTAQARYMIVGEPTGLRAVYAGKGYALGEIVVRGREAHSAFPERGRSAIFDAARVAGGLERVAAKLARRKNAAFDPPYTTLNAGLIEGGTAKNIVAGECRITVEWRPVPGQDAEWAARLIVREIAALQKKLPRLDAKLEVKRLDPPLEPSRTDRLVKILESLTGKKATTVSFGTEAAHLRREGGEAVVFGPGDMSVAHRSGEYVPVKDLAACVQHLRAVIARLCG